MGWIKCSDPSFSFPNGYFLNVARIDTFYITKCKREDDLYRLNCEIEETSYLLFESTKQEVEETMTRIERWLESGAEGIFQV